MGRADDSRPARVMEKLVTGILDLGRKSGDRPDCGRAQGDNHLGCDMGDLAIQPCTAGPNFLLVGLLVQASLAAGLPFEMLDGVRHEKLRPVDTSSLEHLVEHLACRPNEGTPAQILLITRMLTY